MKTRRPEKRNEPNRKIPYYTDRRSSALHAIRGDKRLDFGQKLGPLASRLVSPVVSEISDDIAKDGRLVLAGFKRGVFSLSECLNQRLRVLGTDGAEFDIARLYEVSFSLGHFVCSELSQSLDFFHGFGLFSLIVKQNALAFPDPPSELVGWDVSIREATTQGGKLLEDSS